MPAKSKKIKSGRGGARKNAGRKKGSGRPSAYKPEFAAQAKKLCELGATDADLADFFGVSITTIANWKVRHAEFFDALKASKDAADARVERSLYNRAVGYTFDAVKIFLPKDSRTPVIVPHREHVPPDTTAAIFWLKNRQRDRWRDVQAHEHAGKDGGPIETKELNDTERARRIAYLLHRAANKKDKP